MALGALLGAPLAPAAGRGAEAAACTTEGATVGYVTAYDAALKADVIRGVRVAGLSIACDGHTVVVVLTKGGATVAELAGIVVIGTVEVTCNGIQPAEILCTSQPLPVASVDGAWVYLSQLAA